MAGLHAEVPELSYQVADCRFMPQVHRTAVYTFPSCHSSKSFTALSSHTPPPPPGGARVLIYDQEAHLTYGCGWRCAV